MLKDELVDRTVKNCRSLATNYLSKEFFKNSSDIENRAKYAPPAELFDLIIWNVLVSFFVSIISNLAYDTMKQIKKVKDKKEILEGSQAKKIIHEILIVTPNSAKT